MLHYFDTSALAKLVLKEAESGALLEWIMTAGSEAGERGLRGVPLLSSELVSVELVRAIRRLESPALDSQAREVLDRVELVKISAEVLTTASRLAPPSLRTLDAIHLATALQLGSPCVVTYDERMLAAAESLGLETLSPGR